MESATQLSTKTLESGIQAITAYLERAGEVDVISMEDYRVYSWESEKHKWAELHTPKLIGAVYAICYLKGMRAPEMRMAQSAKGFVTDVKLKSWGLYEKAERHSRDAIRHAVHHLIFGA